MAKLTIKTKPNGKAVAHLLPDDQLPPVAAPLAPGQSGITLIGTDGQWYEFPEASAPAAIQQGFRRPTTEEFQERTDSKTYGEGIVNELEAAALGVARGLSFGVSDLALRKLAPKAADAAQKLEKYNPDASTAGQLGSFLVPGLGSLGAAGKIASKAGALQKLVSLGSGKIGDVAAKIVGENLAGKAVGAGVKLAAEAAVYQAAQNLSEDTLYDRELTAESILAHTGQAAILGAGIGVALPVAARGVQKLAQTKPVQTVANAAANSFAKFFDPDRSLQLYSGAMSQGKLMRDTIEGQRFKTAVRELRKDFGESFYGRGTVELDPLTGKLVRTAEGGLPTQPEAYQRLEGLLDTSGKELGAILQNADDVVRAGRTAPLSAAGAIDGEASYRIYSKAAWGPQDAAALKSKINGWEANARISASEAERLRTTVDEIGAKIASKEGRLSDLHGMRIDLDARVGGKNWDKLGSEEIEIVKELRRGLSKKIDAGLEAIGAEGILPPDTFARWKRLNRLYSNLKTIQAPLDWAKARAEANVNVGGLRWRDLLATAVGSSAGAAVGGPIGSAIGGSFGVANKLLQTDAGLLMRAEMGEKLMHLAWAEKLLAKSQADIASAIKGFVSRADAAETAAAGVRKYGAPVAYATTERVPPAEQQKSQQEWFAGTQKQLADFLANQEGFASRQGAQLQPLSNAAPGLAESLVSKQLQINNYLAGVMPRNPGSPANVFEPNWQPSDYEIQRFRKVVQVARDPLTILQDLRTGTVSKGQVDAVRALYPKLYQSMLDQVRATMSAPGAKLAYDQRVKLGLLFPGTEPTMRGQFVAAMMNATGPAQPKPRAPGGTANIAKNYETATERAANR